MVIYGCILAYAAWVVRQPSGKFSAGEHAKRIMPVFVSPFVAYFGYNMMAYLAQWIIRYTDSQLIKCRKQNERILQGLKDAMRFERTHELLMKYDSEYRSKNEQQRNKDKPQKMNSSNALKGVGVAASTVGDAGIRLSSALGHLWGKAAETLIADDPALVHMLRTAQSQAQTLEAENAELRKQLGMTPRSTDGIEQIQTGNSTIEALPEAQRTQDMKQIPIEPHDHRTLALKEACKEDEDKGDMDESEQ